MKRLAAIVLWAFIYAPASAGYGTPEASSDAGVPWVPASVRIENGSIVDVEAVDTFDYKGLIDGWA